MGNATMMSMSEVAEYLGISYPTAKVLRQRGAFPPYIQIGQSRRWRVQDVEAWLDSQLQDQEVTKVSGD